VESYLSLGTWKAANLISPYRSMSKQATIHFCHAYQLILWYYYNVSVLVIQNVFRAVWTVYSMDTHDSASFYLIV
jgi:hypothetical protein